MFSDKRPLIALKDVEIRAFKPTGKEQKLFDGGGLYLLMTAKGSKLWKMKFRVHSKEKKLSFGAYPTISLKEAREKRGEAKRQLAHGDDPAKQKRQHKLKPKTENAETFAILAREYIAKMEKEGRAPATLKKAEWLLAQLTPGLGKRPIGEITPLSYWLFLKR